MDSQPAVTVLMAVYNGEPYLRQSIESILGQDFGDFEFLIVNDGSTDGTREAIHSYRDRRIRLIDNEPNAGLTRSLNRGLRLARGRLIARQDADDISEPSRLSRQVAYLHAQPAVALAGSWYTKIDGDGNELGTRELPVDSTEIRWRLLFYCPFVHSAVLFRRDWIIEKHGGFDEQFVYAQDYDLWSRVARSHEVANLPERLVRYRVWGKSMTASLGDGADGELIRIAQSNMKVLIPGLDTAEMPCDAPALARWNSFLFGREVTLQPAEAGRIASTCLDLHAEFCEYYRLDRSVAVGHREVVVNRFREGLRQLSRRSWQERSPLRAIRFALVSRSMTGVRQPSPVCS